VRAAAAGLAAAAALLLAAAAGGAVTPPPRPTVTVAAPSGGPTRLQVVAMEFYYILSRHTLSAGPAIVQLVDFGEDPHDLRIERVGGTRVYGTPVIQPGSLYDLHLTLQPGAYELWCSIANHRELGMQARIVVTARAA
jgi:plastocyanin